MEKSFLRVKPLRPGVKVPTRAHAGDAGVDFYWNPSTRRSSANIHSCSGYTFETGVAVEIPEGTMLEIKNKSSVASKYQLLVGACVIDHGYSGEVFIDIHNVGGFTQEIKPGQKIAQGVLVPVFTPQVEVIDYTPYGGKTTRGSGGFGSTGKA